MEETKGGEGVDRFTAADIEKLNTEMDEPEEPPAKAAGEDETVDPTSVTYEELMEIMEPNGSGINDTIIPPLMIPNSVIIAGVNQGSIDIQWAQSTTTCKRVSSMIQNCLLWMLEGNK